MQGLSRYHISICSELRRSFSHSIYKLKPFKMNRTFKMCLSKDDLHPQYPEKRARIGMMMLIASEKLYYVAVLSVTLHKMTCMYMISGINRLSETSVADLAYLL